MSLDSPTESHCPHFASVLCLLPTSLVFEGQPGLQSKKSRDSQESSKWSVYPWIREEGETGHKADRAEDGKTLKRTCHSGWQRTWGARALGNRPIKTKAGRRSREKLHFKGERRLINTKSPPAQYCKAKIGDFPMIFHWTNLMTPRSHKTCSHNLSWPISMSLNYKVRRCYLKGEIFNYWL